MSSKTAVLRLFRALLKLSRDPGCIHRLIQPSVRGGVGVGGVWGQHGYISASSLGAYTDSELGRCWSHQRHPGTLAEQQSILADAFPSLPVSVDPQQPFSPDTYRQLVTQNFRASKDSPDELLPERLDEALKALRFLSEQRYLNACTGSETTDGVNVTITSWYERGMESWDGMPPGADSKHFFTYRVSVRNDRRQPIKVMGRGWVFKNASDELQTVVPLGLNGVVGQTPIIAPGECFQYYSFTYLDTDTGSMEGKLQVSVLGDWPKTAPTMTVIAQVPCIPLQPPEALQSLRR